MLSVISFFGRGLFSQQTISFFRTPRAFLAPEQHTQRMPSRRLVRDPERYKTTPCRNGWNDPTNCPYGWRCQHAHWEEEMRARSSRTYTPPAPPPSTVQSPVTIITETLAPSNFQLSQPVVYNLPPLPPEPPPPLPTATPFTPEDLNETLDYLESVLATMRGGD